MIDTFFNVISVLALILCIVLLLTGIITFIIKFYYFIKELKIIKELKK